MTTWNLIFSAYDLDRIHLEIEPIHKGLINSTWHLFNTNHSFILQKINQNVFKNPESIASNIRRISDYLLKHSPDYLFVAPIATRNNKEMVHIPGEGYYRLIPFVEGSHTISTVECPSQAFEAAKQFGKFTRLSSGFPAEELKITLPDFHDLSLRYQQFSQSLKSGNKDRMNQSDELIQLIKDHRNLVNTYERIIDNPSFKRRVTHHDTKISNVLFNKEDKGVCVIDLDTVMPGYFISDVGDMMRTYLSPVNEEENDFSKIEIRDAYFKSIWDGYMGEMKNELNAQEKEHFIYAGQFMIYMQALRFLTDYLNNDTYYGATYENQNLVRAGNQLTLLQRLKEKENILKAIIEER